MECRNIMVERKLNLTLNTVRHEAQWVVADEHRVALKQYAPIVGVPEIRRLRSQHVQYERRVGDDGEPSRVDERLELLARIRGALRWIGAVVARDIDGRSILKPPVPRVGALWIEARLRSLLRC